MEYPTPYYVLTTTLHLTEFFMAYYKGLLSRDFSNPVGHTHFVLADQFGSWFQCDQSIRLCDHVFLILVVRP